MRKENKFNQLASKPTLLQTLKNVSSRTGEDIFCMRIGFIEEFNPEDLTAIVRIAAKKAIGQNKDGTQQVRDYALISAKVCYCNPYITFPPKQGDECLLFFADTEIESWFISGEALPEGYPRIHDITDAVAVLGISSMPKMIEILESALHLFYYGVDIQLKGNELVINAPFQELNASSQITLNAPDVNVTGNLNVATGYSGLVPCGAATLTVTNGIITGVS